MRDCTESGMQRGIRWCDRAGVGYVIALARNSGLEATVSMVEMVPDTRGAAIAPA